MDLRKHIRTIPDWPKPGILFYDIMPLMADRDAFAASVNDIAERYKDKKIDYIVAIDARGFILGSAIAYRLNAGFVPIRKQGKLPFKTQTVTYDLEYGSGTLEIQADAIKKDSNVLMVDDLLATGGTMAAACQLVEKLQGKIIAIAFLMELKELNGRQKIQKYKISSELVY
ncbi:MAG: Adenine phosphoribosyltransferase [Planctomycetes bacterium ADurb.Bin401]|nr:MAG: Adenine phosphoribosyltransferase [Planctomycetes bacterium ADurb.Bin401]